MKVKLGIIGYGGMGKWHAQNAPRAGVRIAAVCDIEDEKIKQAKEDGFVTYDSAEALLQDEDVNTVVLTVPNHLHKEMCIKAAKAGKHIVTEKPAALDIVELDEMELACKKAGVFLTVHQNRRWDKDMLIVKKAYEEGLLGNIFTIESKLHSANGYMHEWHLYKKYGGGMIYDWGVHLIDQILFMMPDAKINSVYADIKNVLHDEVDDYFKIILKMNNGVTAHIELSTYILNYAPRWLVGGDKGTMVIKTFAGEGAVYKTGVMLSKLPAQITETVAGPTRQFAPVPPGGIVEEPLPEVETDWIDFYRNVTDVLNNKAESKIKIAQVRRVLGVMEAARKSAESGKSILLEQ
ncbi:Gfo/Idh/MocA family protein [Anaerosacchariphilus polymeriproducens]|uniref:Gfo/Idh/MocA family oxidoreductase n=1 Tax=Anaerosacchariphilus polymeriproducens TaxID=1812858 RepID=A0A371AYI2_9FIRM|nr:Gfo/Idh/MocA family oxidoreductase [Anaerosacchariphilus polymeriproducens]RDU24627.1 gfo/Idh/MocA family oxidoreductase [Anaerosacchariphilus polymeriproducens]